MGKLVDSQLRQWIAVGKPVTKTDGDGLTFTLSAKGTAAWTLRYRIFGKRKELTMGRYPELSLAAARQEAWVQRERVALGIDVAAIKAASRREKGLICEIASLEGELQRYELAVDVIRSRLKAARLELGRKIEGDESWAN